MAAAQATVTTESSLGKDTKKLGVNALVYLASNMLVRGVTFLLTPLYTREMGPADFAVVSVTNSLVAVLSIVLGMALFGCIPRLFFEYKEGERRAFFGTILTLSLAVPGVIVAGLYALGEAGHLDLFETVRFDPHLKLVLWTSLFSVYAPLPVAIYMSREEPRKAALLNMLSGFAQLGLTLLLVAVMHGGAVGVLRANLLSSAVVGFVSIVLMLRLSTLSLALPGCVQALAYCLPLVPHLIANWALAISDRIVLDRYVPAADLGRYSLGCMFGLVVSVVAASLWNALSPVANRYLKDPDKAANVPLFGTYVLAVTTGFALALALGAREVISIIAPPAYQSAAAVVPWVVLGSVFQGIYLVWSIGTWFSMKTKLVPVVTAISAAANIGANIIFVPRYGMMAAAVSTAGSYALSAGLHGALAQHLYPIRWEYARWARVFGVGAVCYLLGESLPTLGARGALVEKLLFAFLAFPAGLALARFFTRSEVVQLRALVARLQRS